MKNLFRNIILLILLSFGNLFATSGETATKFNTTIEEIALYNGTSWVVIASSPRTFDIASATAGEAVGQMAGSVGNIPDGTYTKLRVKIGGSFEWTSSSYSGSGDLNFGPGGVGTNFTVYTNQTTAGTYANGTSGFITLYDTPSLVFPIPEGTQTSFRIDFGVENVVQSNSAIGFPQVRIYINGTLLTLGA